MPRPKSKKKAAERSVARRKIQVARFAAVYVSNGNNATRAYMVIFPNASANTAGTNAHYWLQSDDVIAEIQRLNEEILKREHMGADEALALTARIARLNPKDFYWQPGELMRDGTPGNVGRRKPLSELTDDQARCVAGLKHTQFGIDLQFRDADKALVHVLKKHKILTDRVDVHMTTPLDKLIEGSYGPDEEKS